MSTETAPLKAAQVAHHEEDDEEKKEARGMDNDHEFDLEIRDDQLTTGTSVFSNIMSCLCPWTAPCGFFTLEPNEEAIVVQCGTFTGKATTPGIHWASCWGRELHRVSKRQVSVDLPTIKCLDLNGNPLNMSAILVYRFERTERAALAVQNRGRWINNQATSTLRKVVSEFPYETADDSPSLKTHQSLVSRRLVAAAKRQLLPSGAVVVAFQINEISYAPEIAAAMLKRQQADALVQARSVLVSGCTQIALDAVKILEDADVQMTDSEKVRLMSNIVTVTASEGGTVNTISVG